jgi:hypothetical protein
VDQNAITGAHIVEAIVVFIVLPLIARIYFDLALKVRDIEDRLANRVVSKELFEERTKNQDQVLQRILTKVESFPPQPPYRQKLGSRPR